MLNEKQKELQKAILEFETTGNSADDYEKLFLAFHRSIKLDSGLTWSQVKEVLLKTMGP